MHIYKDTLKALNVKNSKKIIKIVYTKPLKNGQKTKSFDYIISENFYTSILLCIEYFTFLSNSLIIPNK